MYLFEQGSAIARPRRELFLLTSRLATLARRKEVKVARRNNLNKKETARRPCVGLGRGRVRNDVVDLSVVDEVGRTGPGEGEVGG